MASNSRYAEYQRLLLGHNSPMPPVGTGERFDKLEASIAAKGNVRNPAAVAASIGRKKYGKKRFQSIAAKGKPGY